MLKFFLNANLSPQTQEFLQKKFGYDVKTTRDLHMNQASDEEIIKLAKKEKRIIITLDLDFGEFYYFSTPKNLGVIVLRLKDQTVEMVNKALGQFFQLGVVENNSDALIVVDEKKHRIKKRSGSSATVKM